ncbi:type VI secretion system-associated FHA domain protein TagH [Pseudoduganella namucuonensis]|uniref:FHA domain protein n=1 Tax=Pseudoduganella namucuonensis TaxID=1035707 RepID=A0A1I7KPY1_9BURK|nr:type VI secretion system-associated FHA domain protein TagH [Pseudoduganella namucuonensis]SFU99485.1 FHA domain protein [Pseudoduganella namucuonensis]
MITIQAISVNGAPPAQTLRADFDQAGGTIGRADGNALVLPDPERHISRTHATIAYRDGGYVIRDLGTSSPLILNGLPLGKGCDARLAGGDRLEIGSYVLEVLADNPAKADAPRPAAFDDPLGIFGPADTDPFTGAAPARQPPPSRLPADEGAPAPPSSQSIDHLFCLDPAKAADPFGGGHPLGEPAGMGDGQGASLDPLVAMGVHPAPRPVPGPQRDDTLEIHAAFAPPPPSPASEPPPADRTPMPAVPPDADLLRAFLAGAGVPDLDLRTPLTPAMMHTLGQLLRASTQGTLDLLLARALIKREVQAAVTMIVPRENNPLKFSPSVEAALSHLLAPRGQGFMDPVAAIEDACADLRAHQFGVMAGMRTALDGLLHRFDPAQLERRLSANGVLDALLPMNRKARLWDLFGELYKELTREAEDDFHALFGKEFVRAYEAQLDRLDHGAQPGRN